ncbi:MAG: T9SS type A sorting domain-containing protein [bacterium]|nr:T9SS type A sorting domain-containing protein [bacterium]
MNQLFLWTYVFGCACLNAQGFRSVFTPSGASTCESYFIEETTPLNYFALGLIARNLGNVTYSELVISGLNNAGAVTWEKRTGSPSSYHLDIGTNRQAIKSQGNIYYAGVLRQGVQQNGAFLKFDFNGNILWQKVFSEAGATTVTGIVAPSVDGGFLLAGFTETANVAGRPALLIKTDVNGNLLWKKKYVKAPSNVIYGRCVLQDKASKKIVIAGSCYGTAPDSLYPILIITDSIGNQIEQRIGIEQGYYTDMAQLADGSIILVGSTITSSLTSTGSANLMYSTHTKLCLDSANFLYRKNFDSPNASNWFNTVNAVSNGTEYITNGTIDTLYQYFPPYRYDEMVRITKFNANGMMLSNRYYSYPRFADPKKPYFDNRMYSKHMGITSDKGLVAAVQINNYSISDPLFYVKFDSTGCDSSIAYCQNPTGLTELASEEGLFLFPVPAHDYLMVDQTKVQDKFSAIEIVDALGKRVKSQVLLSASEAIDIKELDEGCYFVLFKNDKGQVALRRKLIIE